MIKNNIKYRMKGGALNPDDLKMMSVDAATYPTDIGKNAATNATKFGLNVGKNALTNVAKQV